MFQVGDKVFYPMHGAGVVKAIEKREIQGKEQKYYVINIPISKMDVMIPRDNVGKLDIRSAVAEDKLKGILRSDYEGDGKVKKTWSQRHSSNLEKIKTGEIQATFEVIRDLIELSKEKALNATERDLLNNARRLLISELTIVKDITESQASDLLEKSS